MLVIAHEVAKGKHGLGLFTKEALQAGQLVCNDDYRMVRIVTLAEIDTYPPVMQEHMHKFSYHGVGEDALEDAVYYNTDDTRFINHDDHPNLKYRPESATYVAVCDLPAGTELTCNYADFARRGEACFNF